ncbi:LppP/LprE family lipoprotein [Corynebacterium gerontici]|nr:LppP/LprE family lipoprotein [Corynebacterium gerontici]
MPSFIHSRLIPGIALSTLLSFSLAGCIDPSDIVSGKKLESGVTTATESPDDCSANVPMESLEQHAEELPKLNNQAWPLELARVDQENPCATLSYIAIPLGRGTVSTPMQVALFHNGQFLGPATEHIYSFAPEINRINDATIAVTYRFREEGESNAEASGYTTVVFEWDEDSQKVRSTGEFPPSN